MIHKLDFRHFMLQFTTLYACHKVASGLTKWPCYASRARPLFRENHMWLVTAVRIIIAMRHIKPRPEGRSLMANDQSIGRGVKPLWVAHHGDRSIRVGDGRRPACAVDHVQDATKPGLGKEDCQQ